MFSGTWCGGMGAGGWLLMVAFWTAFLGLTFWAVTRAFPSSKGKGFHDSASLEVDDAQAALDRRLASGEIDVETYRRLKDELRAGSR